MNPPSVKDIAKKWYTLLPFSKEYNQAFDEILEKIPETQACSLEEYDWSIHETDQYRNLVMVLFFLEELKSRYDAKGIAEDIFWETAKEITVYARRCKEATGSIGIQRLPMSLRILTMHLFRIGRLQFCMEPMPADIPEKDLHIGDAVLDLHITEDGTLDINACKESVAMAEDFFAKYFPDFTYQYYTCNSWLMDEGLAQFLPENSNIIKFQKLFEIYNKRAYDSILHFMFKYGLSDREEIRDIPASTLFSKKIKEYALAGGTFYIACGVRDKNCDTW